MLVADGRHVPRDARLGTRFGRDAGDDAHRIGRVMTIDERQARSWIPLARARSRRADDDN